MFLQDNYSFPQLLDNFSVAVQRGNIAVAGEMVKMAIKKDGFGYNFLHDNVLNFTNEKLPPFKQASVTKKTHISHSVCLNYKFVTLIVFVNSNLPKILCNKRSLKSLKNHI